MILNISSAVLVWRSTLALRFYCVFFFVNPYPLREPWQCFMLAMAFFISFPIIHLTLRGFIQLYLSKPEYLNACLCVCMCVECLIILL